MTNADMYVYDMLHSGLVDSHELCSSILPCNCHFIKRYDETLDIPCINSTCTWSHLINNISMPIEDRFLASANGISLPGNFDPRSYGTFVAKFSGDDSCSYLVVPPLSPTEGMYVYVANYIVPQVCTSSYMWLYGIVYYSYMHICIIYNIANLYGYIASTACMYLEYCILASCMKGAVYTMNSIIHFWPFEYPNNSLKSDICIK